MELTAQFQEMYGLPAGGVHPNTQQIFATEAKLQNIVTELNNRLLKVRQIWPATTARAGSCCKEI